MRRRSSGVLCHVSSLPSAHGIGDMGPSAYDFADFLSETRQSFWQILPLNPTETVHYNSPYQSISAFAFNPLLISPEGLVEEGLVSRGDIENGERFPEEQVDYEAVSRHKQKIFARAFEAFRRGNGDRREYEIFCSGQSFWLEDFALFSALRSNRAETLWIDWPEELRNRDPGALNRAREEFHESIERTKFLQYAFYRQWMRLKTYCNDSGIQIIGDIPIYVQYDSADVWANPEYFKLDRGKRPYVVSGVPPDYFSETGQLWGNPVYRWEALKETEYDWWLRRMTQNLRLVDLVRIDHFRGLVAYWEVPAEEKTALNGRWMEAPADDFFNTLLKKFPLAPFIAEDLGYITPDVRETMRRFGFPGMKLLLFAFQDDPASNPYAPHNAVPHCVMYTGTHDNNTAKGWFEEEATPETREKLFRYIGREISGGEVSWELIRLVMMSVANTAVFPVQDLLGLGARARMNRPSVREGNWMWRLAPGSLTADLREKLLLMTRTYGRS